MQKISQLFAYFLIIHSSGIQEYARNSVLHPQFIIFPAAGLKGVAVFSQAKKIKGHNQNDIRVVELIKA